MVYELQLATVFSDELKIFKVQEGFKGDKPMAELGLRQKYNKLHPNTLKDIEEGL